MQTDFFGKTTIGADFLKNGQFYPVDLLLDYLSGLIKMKKETSHNDIWMMKYENEINAVKQILSSQTAVS